MVHWTLGSCQSICPCMIFVAAAKKSKAVFVQSTAFDLWVTMELLGRVLQPLYLSDFPALPSVCVFLALILTW